MSIMDKPPNVLSVKDNIFIKDLLEVNLLGIKTFKEFSTMTKDQEIKSLLESVVSMHNKHYKILLESLKDCEN